MYFIQNNKKKIYNVVFIEIATLSRDHSPESPIWNGKRPPEAAHSIEKTMNLCQLEPSIAGQVQ